MFSSLLPSVSSSLKFGQNGPSKSSSRFSVRVFKAPMNTGFGYSTLTKPDVDYSSTSQRDAQNNNWYPSSTYPTTNYEPQQRLRGVGNFSIYPSATNDTFIYEQSTCSKSDIFSTSEMDSESTVTFSPSSAFSPSVYNDSSVTFPSGDRAPDNHPIHRAPTPGPRSGYSIPPQPQFLTRTASAGEEVRRTRVSSLQQQQARSAVPMYSTITSLVAEPMSRVPSGGGRHIHHIPEYAASSISELEVEQRDKIAQINAEYNSYTSSSGSGSIDADRRWMSSIPVPIPGRDSFTRVPSSQPLHPNLHFPPTRDQEAAFHAPPPPVFHLHTTNSANPSTSITSSFSHNPYSLRGGDSPPLVERISSQTPQPSGHHPLPSVPGNSWSRDATFDSEETTRGTGPYRTSPKTSPISAPAAPTSQIPQQLNGASVSSAYATHATSSTDTAEYVLGRHQERPAPVDAHRQHHRRRSLIAGPRPDPALSRSQSEAREYPPTSSLRVNDVSTYGGREREREWGREQEGEREQRERERDPHDQSYSPPRAPQAQGSPPRDSSNRASFAADLRRDTRTPVVNRDADEDRTIRSSRRDSYAPETQRASKDARTKSPLGFEQTRETYTVGPLTDSPTQTRMSPADVEPPPVQHHRSPAIHENERAGERVRTRSVSLSHSSRPTTPAPSAAHYPPLSQQPQVVYNGTSEPRQQGADYERRQRTGETSPSFVSEPLHADFDQRKDIRGSNAQGTYPQPQPPSPPRYESTSQRQQMPIPPPSTQTPPRAMERSPSMSQSVPPSRARGVSTQERPRSSFAEPVYTHPHAEPLRRHSDDDEPYKAIPHDKPGSKSTRITITSAHVTNSAHSSHSGGSTRSEPQPQRRHSDGDQNPLPNHHDEASGRKSAPLLRSVHWNENLICPSPILTSQRRKGWFNRRGDQLWTNDGAYKPPPTGEEYPADLEDYPAQVDGWMNEECVRIDLNHRLIPKPPLRSALKQSNLRS